MALYSHSRLGVYKQCPLRYKLKYLDRVPEDMQTVEAFMGQRVHESLEKLYRNVVMAKTLTLAEISSYYERIWDEKWTGDVKTVKKEMSPDDYRNLGLKCIRDYYQAHHPFMQSQTVAVEKMLSFSLDEEGKYKMRGYIDRLSISGDGAYQIHDYKTAGRLPTQRDKDEDKQLALYHLAVKKMWNNVGNVTLHWHYLVFGQELSSARDDIEIERLRLEKIALIDEIEAAVDFPPRESALCGWCSYQRICPLRKHLVIIKALPESEAQMEEGFQLVDRLDYLQSEKKELDGRIEVMKASIIDYSAREGADRIFGSEKVAKIKREEKFSFPDTQREKARRALLEDTIREMGRWDEASSLDVRKLGGVLEERSWRDAEISRIEPFAEREERISVTLSKKK